MDNQEQNPRLNQIPTQWSVVRQAHGDDSVRGNQAREALLERYGGAIYRYLLGALRNVEAAEELSQEFACRFLNGSLRGADPTRGRFRDYVKGVLYHLVVDYQRKQRRANSLGSDLPEPGEECSLAAERDRAFLEAWRDEILARTWIRLEEVDRQQGQHYFTVLRYRAEHPDQSSSEMAQALTQLLAKPISAEAGRQTLKRARDRFTQLMLEEVAQGQDSATTESVTAELIDLGLYEYCRSSLERRGRAAEGNDVST